MSVCRCFLMIAAASVLCLVCPTGAQAQSTLPNDIVGATGNLGPDQVKQVNHYVQERIAQLTGNDPAQRSHARQELIDPFNFPGASDGFKSGYSAALGSLLAPVLNDQNVEVRLNAMIVASHMTGAGVAALAQTGLADQSAAVRYWAAKAVINSGKRLSPPEQQQALTALAAASARETSVAALEQMFLAMNALTVPEAQTQLLTVLNQRIAVHADPSISFRADLAGLQSVAVAMVTAASSNHAIATTDVKLFTTVLFRDMDLVTRIFEQKQATDENTPDMQQMLVLTGNYLAWAAGQLVPKPASPLPQSIKDMLGGDWQSVRQRVEEWRRLLTSPEYQFQPAGLQIPDMQPATAGP